MSNERDHSHKTHICPHLDFHRTYFRTQRIHEKSINDKKETNLFLIFLKCFVVFLYDASIFFAKTKTKSR